ISITTILKRRGCLTVPRLTLMSLIKMMLVMVSVAAISKTFGLLRFLLRLSFLAKWRLLPHLLTLWVCKLLMLICILTKNVITSCSVTMMLFLHLEVKPLMTLTTLIAINGHIKFNLTIPLQQLNGLETLVIIMVANKYAFLQITRRRFLNEWEAFKKVISRRNIRRRITIPLTLSNLKLLRRITRTENILHRNFTRRQVAIQNRVA